MSISKKRLLLFAAVIGFSILLVFGSAYYQINKAGRESCIASLESFIAKQMENTQIKNSISLNEEWRIITKQEQQLLLLKAVESEKLDCNNIRYNYEEGDYWGKDFVISMRVNTSTKRIEVKIEDE